MSDYWKMVVTEALEEIDCLKYFDEEKLSSLASDMDHAADMRGESCGWPAFQLDSKPPSEKDQLINKLKAELERERNAESCDRCKGRGHKLDCWGRQFACEFCQGGRIYSRRIYVK